MAEVKLASLNKVMLIGRLTQDPELRRIPSGDAVTNLRLAVNRRFKDKSGEWRDDTCFVNAVFWRKQAELTERYLKKGSAVFVEGRLQSRSWDTKEGEKRTTIEVSGDRVEFLDKLPRRDDGVPAESASASRESFDAAGPSEGDDIPF